MLAVSLMFMMMTLPGWMSFCLRGYGFFLSKFPHVITYLCRMCACQQATPPWAIDFINWTSP